jgi:hypothetical protein
LGFALIELFDVALAQELVEGILVGQGFKRHDFPGSFAPNRQ